MADPREIQKTGVLRQGSYILDRSRQIRRQMQEQYLFMLLHLTYFIIHSMQQTDLLFGMQEIFTEDLQILQKMYLKRESLLWREEQRHLLLLREQRHLRIHSRHLRRQESILLHQKLSTAEPTIIWLIRCL